MNWIRIATKMKGDPRMGAIAGACKVRIHEAVGLVCCTLMEFPDHARSGDVAAVPDVVLEQWAMWTGKTGVFAQAFRAHLCDETGVVRAWEKHNGKALQKAEEDIARKRAARAERERGAKTARAETAPSARQIEDRRENGARKTSGRRQNGEVDETRRKETTSSAAAAAVVSAEQPAAAADSEPVGLGWAEQRRELLARFDDPTHRAAVDGFLRSAAHPILVAGHIVAALDPDNGGHDPAHVGKALDEMLVNGAERFHAATFAGYLRRVKAGESPAGAVNSEPTWDDLIAREEAAARVA